MLNDNGESIETVGVCVFDVTLDKCTAKCNGCVTLPRTYNKNAKKKNAVLTGVELMYELHVRVICIGILMGTDSKAYITHTHTQTQTHMVNAPIFYSNQHKDPYKFAYQIA